MVRADDPNLPGLRAVAEALGDLCERVVFVGGSTAGLLLTDPVAGAVRATLDVDAIVEADGLPQFHRIEAEVAERGFERDAASEVICRWRHRASGVLFDLMPVDASVLGFTNRWYADAVRTAERVSLGDGLDIRVVTAPAFVATKLEAFVGRGRGDFLSSHDLEDILNIVDGRSELVDELADVSGGLLVMGVVEGSWKLRHLYQPPVLQPDRPPPQPRLLSSSSTLLSVVTMITRIAQMAYSNRFMGAAGWRGASFLVPGDEAVDGQPQHDETARDDEKWRDAVEHEWGVERRQHD